MNHQYTESAEDRFFDLFDEGIESLWEELEALPEATDAERWKLKFQSIVNEYMMTSRFALMRLCQEWYGSTETESFEADIDGIHNKFTVTMEHAKEMRQEELTLYSKLLFLRAGFQDKQKFHKTVGSVLSQDDMKKDIKAYLDDLAGKVDLKSYLGEWDSQVLADEVLAAVQAGINLTDQQLINNALKNTKKALSRDEAFRLGHLLHFSPEDMQFYLLRTYEEDAVFRFYSSNDLIEMYGLLVNADWKKVKTLKYIYSICSRKIEKKPVEEKKNGFTVDASYTLPEKINEWDEDHRDALFIQWLLDKSAFLDVPSKTSLTIYRNLAGFAYNIIWGKEPIPDVDHFVNDLLKIINCDYERKQTISIFYENGVFSHERCLYIVKELTSANENYNDKAEPDLARRWRYLKSKNGKPSAQGGIDSGTRTIDQIRQGDVYLSPEHIAVIDSLARKAETKKKKKEGKEEKEFEFNCSRSRIEDILWGDMNVLYENAIDKADMLFLLWVITMLCIADDPATSYASDMWTVKTNRHSGFNWLANFINISEICMNKALLPSFYPPHLLEQSMILSLVYAGLSDQDPAKVYDDICFSLKEKRNRKKGKKEKD